MAEIRVSKIDLKDLQKLQSIGKQTFFATFADVTASEDMAQYLEESFSVEKLTTELTNPESEFYFAYFNQQVIGYLKINFGSAQTEPQGHKAMEIERIYVLDEFHGKKVGLTLYNTALQIATTREIQHIWLGVWENNMRAIRFYQKQGFIEFDKHIFKLGNDESIDLLMKLVL